MSLVSRPEGLRSQKLLWLCIVGALACSAAWAGSRWYLRRIPINHQIALGKAALRAGSIPGAESAWRKALAADPDRSEPYWLLSNLYIDIDQPARAVPLLQRLEKIDPKSPHTICRLAEAFARSGQDAKALQTARQAVVVEPGCPRAHAILGIELSNRMDHPQAIAELSRARQLAPGDDKIALSLAQAQLNAADLDAAAATIQGVLRRSPRNKTAYDLLGWCYAREAPTPENHQKAASALSHAIALDPGDLTAVGEMGRLKAQDRDLRGAKEALEKAWRGGERTQDIGSTLASVDRQLGDDSGARQVAEELKRQADLAALADTLRQKLAADSHDTTSAIRLAALDAQQGDLNTAGGLITAVLKTGRQDDLALRTAAQIYGQAGDQVTARALLQKAAAIQGRGGSAGSPGRNLRDEMPRAAQEGTHL